MVQEFLTVSLDFTKAVIQSYTLMHNKELEEFVTTLSLMTCLQMIYIYILNCTNLSLLIKHSLLHGPSTSAFQM